MLLLFFVAEITYTVKAQNYMVQTLNSGISNLINSVYFLNDSIGYAAWQSLKQGGILKTNNGGSTWNNIIISPKPLRSVYFFNTDTGFAVGDDGIFKTIDGGNNWTNTINGYFRSIYFTSIDTGYAAGNYENGYGISKTTDGGNTWTNIFNQSATDFLFFNNTDVGYAAQIESPYTSFYKTTNTGNSWSTINIPSLNNGVASIFFTDSDTGYVGEWEKGIFKTTDGGNTWASLNLGTIFYLHSIYFINSTIGFAVGTNGNNGIILNTIDGGSTWSILFGGGGTSVLTNVFFPNSNVGYVVGNLGTILKITSYTIGFNDIDTDNNLIIFPNPTNGNFRLNLPSTAKHIQILNSLGQIVERKNIENETDIDFEFKESGVYFVQIATNKLSFTKKIIVIK